jgi:sugar lactone lactonase YvrE
MRSRPIPLLLIVSLAAAVVAARPVVASAAPGGATRIVGPRGEATPVVNENNQLQLRVEGAASVSRWSSDSPDVATVSNGGLLTGRHYGFVTITAETAAGPASVIAVVVRKTPRRASRAQGDTKTDTGGNVYLSSPLQHVIYKAGAAGSGVLAGALGQAGYEAGAGQQARFNVPTGLGVDQSARGGIYVADTANHVVRRIRPNGQVEVTLGLAEHAGRMLADRTPMGEAVLDGPRGVIVAGGNLMVADTENHCLWYADLARREVRLLAGEPGIAGSDNGRGRRAKFNRPSGLAVSTNGRLIAVADTGNNVVRLVVVGSEAGETVYDVTTLGLASSRRGAGLAKAWSEDRGDDAIAFDQPESVSIDGVGNVYVIDGEGTVVVTRREDAVERVDLAQAGTLGDPASVTLSGTQAYVLDAAATTDEAVNVVEVGAPEIERLSVEEVGLGGGDEILVEGSNFAPESDVTFGDAPVTEFVVESARRIRLIAPPVLAPGVRTLTVATRGGAAQAEVLVRSARLDELVAGDVTTVAGGVPGIGDGGLAGAASVSPASAAVDAAGNLYIADRDNHRVRRVDAVTRRITTVAGTGVFGYDGDDRLATTAQLNSPHGVAVDTSGNLFIADTSNHRVRRVDAVTGRITTVAGTGTRGYDGDDAPAASALLNFPFSVAVDGAGNLFVADSFNNRIRRVDAVTGRIATVAGTGEGGYDGDDKPATSARLNLPSAVAVDGAGRLYIADYGNNRIRRVDASGTILTVAGTGIGGYDGDDGPATSARLFNPEGIALDTLGSLYIADFENNRIRRVDVETGQIRTVAGTGVAGFDGDDGIATSALLDGPFGVTADTSGNLYVADSRNHRIRRVDAATGRITTFVGTGEGSFGGDDTSAVEARLSLPAGLAFDPANNLYIADASNHRVRRVDAVTGRIATIAGTGEAGYGGDGVPATTATLQTPFGVAVDAVGNVYIADRGNNRVRRVDAAGEITTVAGTGEAGYGGDGMPSTAALLDAPSGVAVDASGNVYVADTNNHRVRRVDAVTGIIATVAGTGEGGFNGDGRSAASARLNAPATVAVGTGGDLYIADTANHRIRRVDVAGRITTAAGTGTGGFTDDRPAVAARLNFPEGVAVDASGNVYIADTANLRIRRVDASGRISTVAGNGVFGYEGDNGLATLARLNFPSGLAVDSADNLFVADTSNSAIRAVKGPIPGGGTPAPTIRRAVFKDAAGKLVIAGSDFGAAGATVAVNGVDVSSRIRKQSDVKVVLRGSAADLALQTGPNEITVTAGGRTSAVFVLVR